MDISSQASMHIGQQLSTPSHEVKWCTYHRENSLHLEGSRGAPVFLVDYKRHRQSLVFLYTFL